MKTSGFTMIELLFVLLLGSIILRFSCSAFEPFLQKQNIQLTTTQLLEAFQFTRTEAIMRNQVIGICGSHDQQHCGDNWSFGYLVFKKDPHEKAEAIQPKNILYTAQFKSRTPIMSTAESAYLFTGEGNSLTRGTINVGERDKVPLRQLVIFDSGRIRIIDRSREKAC